MASVRRHSALEGGTAEFWGDIDSPVDLAWAEAANKLLSDTASKVKHNPGGSKFNHDQGSHGRRTASTSVGITDPFKYAASLSEDQKKAVGQYTGSEYKNINKHLRFGSELYSENKSVISDLDAAIAGAPPIKPKTLYRAMGKSPTELGMEVGSVFTDAGYNSTTRSARVMFELNDLKTRVTIKAPQGTTGLQVERISKKKFELEVILPRNTSYKVLKIEQADFGFSNVTVEIVS